MMFLIRDAPNDYGFESGDRMVDALLKKGLLEDPQAGEDIRACFDKVRGFNMPHPGEEIGRGFRGAGASYHAIVQAMSPSFKQYVKEFVETLLSPGSLPVKKVNGKTLTCGGLLHLFKEYSKAFQSGKLPKPTTFSEANMRVTNTDAVEHAREEYLARMYEWFRNSDRCPPIKASELECFHRSALGKSKDVFYRDSCGAARHLEAYLVRLDDAVEANIANVL
ncbi:atlastin [Aphelenchoides avenae]|nr:atlastin [Aphelenchus avenae]